MKRKRNLKVGDGLSPSAKARTLDPARHVHGRPCGHGGLGPPARTRRVRTETPVRGGGVPLAVKNVEDGGHAQRHHGWRPQENRVIGYCPQFSQFWSPVLSPVFSFLSPSPPALFPPCGPSTHFFMRSSNAFSSPSQ